MLLRPNQGVASADYLAEKFAGKTVAAIYQFIRCILIRYLRKVQCTGSGKRVKIVTAQASPKDSAQDFTVQLSESKESGADVVFLPNLLTAKQL